MSFLVVCLDPGPSRAIFLRDPSISSEPLHSYPSASLDAVGRLRFSPLCFPHSAELSLVFSLVFILFTPWIVLVFFNFRVALFFTAAGAKVQEAVNCTAWCCSLLSKTGGRAFKSCCVFEASGEASEKKTNQQDFGVRYRKFFTSIIP